MFLHTTQSLTLEMKGNLNYLTNHMKLIIYIIFVHVWCYIVPFAIQNFQANGHHQMDYLY